MEVLKMIDDEEDKIINTQGKLNLQSHLNLDKIRKQKKDEARIVLRVSQSVTKSSRYEEKSESEIDNVLSSKSKRYDQRSSQNKDLKESYEEYMPLKPTQYMLENPMYMHQGAPYQQEESSEENAKISKKMLYFHISRNKRKQ